jgi:outer membrane protein assembly factor BamB
MSAWITGVFSLVVGLLLLAGYVRNRSDNPLTSIKVGDLKAKLREAQGDQPALKEEIRRTDLGQRQLYFRYQDRMKPGVYLLVGGVTSFVLCMRLRGVFQRRIATAAPRFDHLLDGHQHRARWSVAATGGLVFCALLAVAFRWTPALPDKTIASPALSGTAQSAAPDFASAEEYARNWPRFRGPAGNGWSGATNLPQKWDPGTGNGILWKVPAPGPGLNSPIVWNDLVFLATADLDERAVHCVDANSGKTLWRQTLARLARTGAAETQGSPATGYAAPSLATDGRRVYAMFGTGESAAFTLDGKQLWVKNHGPLKNTYGHASSLATWHDHVIIQLDQGESEDNRSRLYALSGVTGEIIWQHPRKVGASWASPIVLEHAGKAQVIALAVPNIVACDVNTGAELWRVEGLNGEVTPSPAFASGLLFAISPSEKLMAIRPDGSGNVTKTHVAWAVEEGIPDITSPAADGELLFNLTSSGLLTCLDAKNGTKQWDHDFEMEFHSSPGIADGKLYLFSLKGTALVVKADRKFTELSLVEMSDSFEASPAFAANRIFARGETNLWCFGQLAERLVSK